MIQGSVLLRVCRAEQERKQPADECGPCDAMGFHSLHFFHRDMNNGEDMQSVNRLESMPAHVHVWQFTTPPVR